MSCLSKSTESTDPRSLCEKVSQERWRYCMCCSTVVLSGAISGGAAVYAASCLHSSLVTLGVGAGAGFLGGSAAGTKVNGLLGEELQAKLSPPSHSEEALSASYDERLVPQDILEGTVGYHGKGCCATANCKRVKQGVLNRTQDIAMTAGGAGWGMLGSAASTAVHVGTSVAGGIGGLIASCFLPKCVASTYGNCGGASLDAKAVKKAGAAGVAKDAGGGYRSLDSD